MNSGSCQVLFSVERAHLSKVKLVGGIRRQLNQAAIRTLDLQAVMHSIPLTLHIHGQLSGLLLYKAHHIEVAGGGCYWGKGDCQGQLPSSSNCAAAGLKCEDWVAACMTAHGPHESVTGRLRVATVQERLLEVLFAYGGQCTSTVRLRLVSASAGRSGVLCRAQGLHHARSMLRYILRAVHTLLLEQEGTR